MYSSLMAFLCEHHKVFEALHVISVFAWISGMIFISRICMYHVENLKNSELNKMFSEIELRTVRIILNPAIVSTFVLGLLLLFSTGYYTEIWFHVKFLCVLFLVTLHGYFVFYIKRTHVASRNFYRIISEVIFVIFSIIALLAILKPF
ncbi:TIGR00701 family protein [Anaplasmataceae bacterium AB001_6]|nr:TIGR00701 family protein [Anaplasmataceae bacterium AB001_6]